jgi:hypothetical protein
MEILRFGRLKNTAQLIVLKITTIAPQTAMNKIAYTNLGFFSHKILT